MKYIKGFDTIRAFAVIITIIGHWVPLFNKDSKAQKVIESFTYGGGLGVIIFFVLSGFLITSILLNEKEKNIEGKNFSIIKNFMIRRILRIFPIYYIYIILYFILNDHFIRENIWYFITYTSNLLAYRTNELNGFVHTWSLAVEEQFYLIWPWVIILINKKYIKYVLFASILIGVVSKYIVIYILHHKHPHLVINCFDSFGIGGLYAYIRLNKENCKIFERGFVVVFVLILFVLLRIEPINGLPVIVMLSKTFECLIGLAMIMYVLKNKSEFVRKYILENKFLNFIGKISYGIYLYHFTYDSFFRSFYNSILTKNPTLPHLFSNYYFIYFAQLATLIPLCWLSFRFIEKPIIGLKRKFEYS